MRLHILLRRNENNEYDQSIHDLYQGKIDAFEKERAEKNYYLDSGLIFSLQMILNVYLIKLQRFI